MGTGVNANRDVRVLAEGKGWLAAEKPAGMSVHNAPGEDLVSVLGKGRRFSPIHRLDRETSGIILLAWEPAALRFLSERFRERSVDKAYLALVHGPFPDMEGEWDHPLSGAAGGRRNPQGPPPRLEALTRYRVLDASPHYTLIECRPVTGRTHQIRRHASLAGHPVCGDSRYGTPRSLAFLRERRGFDRLALHAAMLRIAVPEGGETELRSPLPPEMAALLAGDA